MPNLEYIAKHAGVSAATVSRTLRNPDDLTTENQRRIIQVAQELGYDFKRRQLSKKTKQIVFLSFATTMSPEVFHAEETFLPIVQGIGQIIQESGYNLLVADVDPSFTPPPCLQRGDVDGVIFHGLMKRDFWEKHLQALPKVGIQHFDPDLPCSWVKIDNHAISFQAVKHLVELGHTRIGFLTNTIELLISAERYEGYKKAMQYFGLEIDDAWSPVWQRPRVDGLIPRDLTLPSYRPMLEKVFERKNPPTALVCVHDFHARATIATLAEMGLSVPGDVSVIGVHNGTQSYAPSNTTSVIDRLADVCSMAAKMLMEQLNNGEDELKTVFLRPYFQDGKTTVSPRKE